MPPAKALPEAEVETLRDWLSSGAPWPKEDALPAAASKWWAFRKPEKPAVPKAEGHWARNEVDAFILQRLDREGLKPAPEGSRATLIRRLYFNLTGLPPTFEQVRAFESDKSPDAYSRLVEELLASRHYGEKWGRHWLDLVRYSDTPGFELDSYISDALALS